MFRQRTKQIVADRVPKRIVDFLEAVEVDTQDGEGAIACRSSADRAAKMLDKSEAIGQVRQGIMMGHMLNAGFHLFALGDVFRKAEQIALFAGLVRNRKIPGGQDARAVMRGRDRVLADRLQIERRQRFVGQRKQVLLCFRATALRAFADQIAALDAKDGFGGAVEEDKAPIPHIPDGDGQGHVLDDGIEKFLGAAELGGRGVNASSCRK